MLSEEFLELEESPVKGQSLQQKDKKQESKETYGQTRGLSNLEMKHVGKLHARSHLSYIA